MIEDKRISLYDAGGVMDLLCPRCGADGLHHTGVTIIDRAEDGEIATVTTADGSSVSMKQMSNIEAGNPSRRRDGLVISFFCETCTNWGQTGEVIELTIAQHKGSTEIGWRYPPKL